MTKCLLYSLIFGFSGTIMVLKLIINVLHVMISKSIFISIILIFFCVLRGGAGVA